MKNQSIKVFKTGQVRLRPAVKSDRNLGLRMLEKINFGSTFVAHYCINSVLYQTLANLTSNSIL